MAAATMQNTNQKTRNTRSLTGSERLAIIIRWVMVILFFGISYLLGRLGDLQNLSPFEPIVILLLAYALVALITTILLFIPPARSLLGWSYILDIVFISLFAFLSDQPVGMIYPLYFIPLLNAAMNQHPATSLASGFAVALFYTAIWFLNQHAGQEELTNLTTLVVFGVQSMMLILLPWIASTFANRGVAIGQQPAVEARSDLEPAKVYHDRLKGLVGVSAQLAQMTDPTKDFKITLQSSFAQIKKMMPYTASALLLSSGRPRELAVQVTDPPHPADVNKVINVGEGKLPAILGSGAPACQLAMNQEPTIPSIAVMQSCQSVCLVPLRAGIRTYGVLIVASDQANAYTNDHLELLTAIANYTIVALQMTHLSSQLKTMQRQVRTKEQDVRARMARHLHDGPTQQIAAFAMQTDFIKQCFTNRDIERAMIELKSLGDLARKINQEMRLTLAELRPIKLETEGLQPALVDYIERVRSRAEGVEIRLEARDAHSLMLSKETEAILFDIIQESLNNAIKYAQASEIVVGIRREGEGCAIEIRDNGKGFDVEAQREAAAKRGSYGLRTFEERVEMLGGTSTIDSAPGKGATVRVVVPMDGQ